MLCHLMSHSVCVYSFTEKMDENEFYKICDFCCCCCCCCSYYYFKTNLLYIEVVYYTLKIKYELNRIVPLLVAINVPFRFHVCF